MSQIQKFLFDGLPVRGSIVRLTDAWQEVLKRRANNPESGAYPAPVHTMLGEMVAGSVLLQSSIRFNGALVLQMQGDGPVKMAVAEVLPNLGLRATASMVGEMAPDAGLAELVNAHGKGRCAITLDPLDRQAGQQPIKALCPWRMRTASLFPMWHTRSKTTCAAANSWKPPCCWPPTST